MVAEDVVSWAACLGEYALDSAQVSEFLLDRKGVIDEITEFNDEVGLCLVEACDRRRQLVEALAIVTTAGRGLVRVMDVGDESDP